MVKAVFIDYMGTTVDERSPEMAEIVRSEGYTKR